MNSSPRRFLPVVNGTAFGGMHSCDGMEPGVWAESGKPFVYWSDYLDLFALCQELRNLARHKENCEKMHGPSFVITEMNGEPTGDSLPPCTCGYEEAISKYKALLEG